jgi:hypothetical protein
LNLDLFLPSTREATAHIAAGNQPISVHCKTKHKIPEKILPLKKKESQGNNTAIKIISFVLMFIQR